jgi:hypothetical protein
MPLDPGLKPTSIAADSRGNVYVAGTFTHNVTIGTTKLVATGLDDVFLAKLDTGGHVLSVGHWAGPDDPVLAIDAANDVYMAGFFSDTLEFGGKTKPLVAIAVDAFIVKFDPSGQALWSERFGYSGGPYAILSIAVATNGDPVVAGTAAGTIVLGDKTWEAPNPPGSGYSQGFVARLAAMDGSVVWSNASGGTITLDRVVVAVDSKSRTFLAAGPEGSSRADSTWGRAPTTGGSQLRVGFDETGNTMWSHFDEGIDPVAETIDASGRVALVSLGSFMPAIVGTTAFPGASHLDQLLALLFNPSDGTLLSGEALHDGFPYANAAASNGFTFVAGSYSQASATLGSVVLPSPGYYTNSNLFVGELDPTSHFVWGQGFGAGDTHPLVMTLGPDGRVFVVGTTDAAFMTSAGNVAVGNFLAVFVPPTCAKDVGPIPGGNGSRGALADAGPPGAPDASPAMCPATQAEATNGAACPIAMGCSYGSTCCFCMPKECGGQPTLWTCDPLGTPPAACPAEPPAPGSSCPNGARCNYCLPGGRYFANCTPGGWDVGYAQIICN